MIIKSPAAVPVVQFPEGWGNDALIGDHVLCVTFSEEGAVPEVTKSSATDIQTISVAAAIAIASEYDFRTLSHVAPDKPSVHKVMLRVGDISANNLPRNQLLMSERRSREVAARLGEATTRPYLFSGRGMTHTDITVCSSRTAVGYLMSNQDGTITYDQRFLLSKRLLDRIVRREGYSLLFSAPLLHVQARPGRASRTPDDTLCRYSPRSTVHAHARQTHYLDTQRIFARNIVDQPI